MEEELLGPRASNSCSVTAIVSFFHLLPHLHPQDKLAVKPCVAAAEHHQHAVHIKHQGLLGEPLLAGVAVTQLQGEVEQGWVQHPVLVEDYQHHLPDCGGSILNLRRHDFRHLAHTLF